MSNETRYNKTLKYLILSIVSSILIIDLTILSIPDAHLQHSVAIVSLNIAAIMATALGIIAVSRHGLGGNHGKSYLFVTVGIALWFLADLGILYAYFVLKVDEFKQISLLDVFWLLGYVFLVLHLVSIIKTIRIRNHTITLTILSGVVIGFVILNIVNLLPDFDLPTSNDLHHFLTKEYEFQDVVITILYPILDLSLIVPSITILLNIYKDYQHAIPWMLASISLLVNAIADNGYTIQFIDGKASAMPWDLFYIADFIIMSGALFWYNKYHISDHILARNEKK
ncbi:hypothetical protein [Candidatus Nitrosocosmicus franklandus]|uniref:Uncharacterized protein n=1 Tax=Candidatus Nitrosocosmicus franklandianus TaxID=1798806 RepID=A0A484I844_9ARCH|nr:hypothetical protein [Candidatus Nitrosocosmicus franklandus]VFJ13361.1 conserved membrane protein of unknown function [Candidatus Nitrosocosmicus franklandus]